MMMVLTMTKYIRTMVVEDDKVHIDDDDDKVHNDDDYDKLHDDG